MTGYVRQSSAEIVTGATIEAADLNDEFNQLQSAFDAVTGHGHGGAPGEGPPLTRVALAGFGTNVGFPAATGASAFAARTFTGTANEITVTNGDGVSGNPVFSLPSALTFTGKTITGGTFTGITLSGSSIPWLSITSTPTTLAGYGITDAQPLDSELTAIADLAANGLIARTSSTTAAARTLTGTANEITVTNGDGVAGNPTLSLPTVLTFTGKTVTGGTYTGLSNATGRTQPATAGQVQDGTLVWAGTAGGTANALTLMPTPAITSYIAGQVFRFTAGASPNSGATTVAVSGLGAVAIQNSGAALTGGEIAANRQYSILYDGTQFQLQPFASSTPGASSITTAMLQDGAVTARKESDDAWSSVASAATVDLGAVTSRNALITGTTTITSFGNTGSEGRTVRVRFAGALTLTHNATTLILPGSASITTAAGDTALFTKESGASAWRCVDYLRASGQSVVAPTTPFSSSFVSSNQTITAAGSLTLAHSLGGVPTLVSAELICTTANLGYAVNDIVPITLNTQDASTASSRGVVVVPDATNLNIRFGSLSDSIGLLNKTTGASQTITNTSWQLRMRAWR